MRNDLKDEQCQEFFAGLQALLNKERAKDKEELEVQRAKDKDEANKELDARLEKEKNERLEEKKQLEARLDGVQDTLNTVQDELETVQETVSAVCAI